MNAKELRAAIKMMSIPIDFKKLEDNGFIKRIGKLYYTKNINALPEHVGMKIQAIKVTKNGMRLTFYK